MPTLSRLVLIPAAVLAAVLGVAACGIGDDDTGVTLPPIRTTTTTIVPSTTEDTTRYFYKVQPGDNYNLIATRFCVPYDELIALNVAEGENPSLLQVGDDIEIPQNMRMTGCTPASETTVP